jgi:O-antigen/teichoic acid export membrane protein
MSIRAGLHSVRRGARLLRLTPFETDTPEGRRLERYRRVALSAFSSGFARFASVVAALVVIPLSVRYLGSSRYGLYATITAMGGLVGFADLGIGNGLVSMIAEAHGRDDRRAAARATSTAFFFLLGLALVLGVAFVAVYPFVPWPSLFNIGGRGATEAGAASAAFVLGVLLALPLGIVQRAEIGLQESFVASLWQAVGSMLGLAGVVAAIVAGASLPVLVLAVALAPIAALAGNGLDLFLRRRRWLTPRLRDVDWHTGITLLRIGVLFFVLQIAMAVAFESDAIVLAQIRGPDAVTVYSVTLRVFLLLPALLSFALTPLWPAYGEAISRGDISWVTTTFRHSIRLCLAVSLPAAALLLVVARPAIQLWAGVTAPYSLLAAAAVWTVLLSLSGALSMFLNGARVIRIQIVLALMMMASNLALSIELTRRIGISGVVWGTVIAQSVVVLAPCALVARRTLLRLRTASGPSGPGRLAVSRR